MSEHRLSLRSGVIVLAGYILQPENAIPMKVGCSFCGSVVQSKVLQPYFGDDNDAFLFGLMPVG